MSKPICINCGHYEDGMCKKEKFHRDYKMVPPNGTCPDCTANMIQGIKNRFHAMPEIQAWVISVFTICILVAVIVLLAIWVIGCVINAIVSAYHGSAAALLWFFLIPVLVFGGLCCIVTIGFIKEECIP